MGGHLNTHNLSLSLSLSHTHTHTHTRERTHTHTETTLGAIVLMCVYMNVSGYTPWKLSLAVLYALSI